MEAIPRLRIKNTAYETNIKNYSNDGHDLFYGHGMGATQRSIRRRRTRCPLATLSENAKSKSANQNNIMKLYPPERPTLVEMLILVALATLLAKAVIEII